MFSFFVSIGQDRLQNDLNCFGWGVKMYSLTQSPGKLILGHVPADSFPLGHFPCTFCALCVARWRNG